VGRIFVVGLEARDEQPTMRIILLIIVLCVVMSDQSGAQTNAQLQDFYKGQRVYSVVDQMPDYPDLMTYLHNHLSYPDSCLDAGVDDGRLGFSFIIDTSGIVRDVRLLRGGCGENHRAAMIGMIQNMGRWKPGRLKGKLVPVRFQLPVQMCFLDR